MSKIRTNFEVIKNFSNNIFRILPGPMSALGKYSRKLNPLRPLAAAFQPSDARYSSYSCHGLKMSFKPSGSKIQKNKKKFQIQKKKF